MDERSAIIGPGGQILCRRFHNIIFVSKCFLFEFALNDTWFHHVIKKIFGDIFTLAILSFFFEIYLSHSQQY